MPAQEPGKKSKLTECKPGKPVSTKAKATTKLHESMVTGKASSAKAADGDGPVFAYIATLPEPHRGIAEFIDALAAKTLPGLQRSVKWGMSYYGVGDGWCFCCGGFEGHVKLMFINGQTSRRFLRSRQWRWANLRGAWNSRRWTTSTQN